MSLKYKLSLLLVFIFSFSYSNAERIQDTLLMNGVEPIYSYGIDSTNHWWAVTTPFHGNYRVYIDGENVGTFLEIIAPQFSQNGNSWAFFGKDHTNWYLNTSAGMLDFQATAFGAIAFSGNSKVLAYSYFEGSEEFLFIKDKKYNILNRSGKLYLDYHGNNFAFPIKRGSYATINKNGEEFDLYDQVLPIGFWHDGKFVYAARQGDVWEVYKDDEEISESYGNITEGVINLDGTCAVVIAQRQSRKFLSVLFSEEFYEPLEGITYEWAGNLVLHPTEALFGHNAASETAEFVVMNTTDYEGGSGGNSFPEFTHDGEEMYYIGCNIDCFLSLNGLKLSINTALDVERYYAVKPLSRTVAYSTSSTQAIWDLNKEQIHTGRLMDNVSETRYNWKKQRYETLGVWGRQLFMLIGR
jgi:hypothetical protein